MRSAHRLKLKLARGALLFFFLACGRSTSIPMRDPSTATVSGGYANQTGGTILDGGGSPAPGGSPESGGATDTGGITGTEGSGRAGDATETVPFPPKFFGNIEAPTASPWISRPFGINSRRRIAVNGKRCKARRVRSIGPRSTPCTRTAKNTTSSSKSTALFGDPSNPRGSIPAMRPRWCKPG